VGKEKALDAGDAYYWPIILHELLLNHPHWYDIVVNHPHAWAHDPLLLNRPHPFTGFNPYNPLLLPATWPRVTGRGFHTYQGMWLAVDHGTTINDVTGLGRLTNAAAESWQWRLFDKVFITELSIVVARNSTAAPTPFRLNEWLQSPRYRFMSGMAAPFYRRFKTVVIYARVDNRRYVGAPGSPERLALVRIFNPTLTHADMHLLANGAVQEYANGTGARVLITPHLSGDANRALTVQPLL